MFGIERIYLRQRSFEFRRLKTTRCCFNGPPIPVRVWDFPDVIKFHVAALQCIRYGRKESSSGIYPHYDPDRAQKFISSSMSLVAVVIV